MEKYANSKVRSGTDASAALTGEYTLCPFRVDSAMRSPQFGSIYNSGICQCVKELCQAWSKYGGPDGQNCSRLK